MSEATVASVLRAVVSAPSSASEPVEYSDWRAIRDRFDAVQALGLHSRFGEFTAAVVQWVASAADDDQVRSLVRDLLGEASLMPEVPEASALVAGPWWWDFVGAVMPAAIGHSACTVEDARVAVERFVTGTDEERRMAAYALLHPGLSADEVVQAVMDAPVTDAASGVAMVAVAAHPDVTREQISRAFERVQEDGRGLSTVVAIPEVTRVRQGWRVPKMTAVLAVLANNRTEPALVDSLLTTPGPTWSLFHVAKGVLMYRRNATDEQMAIAFEQMVMCGIESVAGMLLTTRSETLGTAVPAALVKQMRSRRPEAWAQVREFVGRQCGIEDTNDDAVELVVTMPGWASFTPDSAEVQMALLVHPNTDAA